jgi:hypothetical protein
MRLFVLKLWRVWQHGFVIALVYGFSLITYFLLLAIAIYFGTWLLGLELNDHDWKGLMVPLLIVSVPLGLGVGARYSPTDSLKAADYPEPADSIHIPF